MGCFVKMTGRFAVDAALKTLGEKRLLKDLFPAILPIFKEKFRKIEFSLATGQDDVMTPLAYNDRWSEHLAPDGSSYYYDCAAGQSFWSCPSSLQAAVQRSDNPEFCPFSLSGPVKRLGEAVLRLETLDEATRERLLFVGHLPITWTNQSLHAYFSCFGAVPKTWLQLDEVERTRCWGWVLMDSAENAEAAQLAMDGFFIEDRRLAVERARVCLLKQ